MSFSACMEYTSKEILEEQISIGGRLIMLIPFGSKIDNMSGFVSVLGREGDLPVLTMCVDAQNGKALLSTIVFKSSDHYMDFVENLYLDANLQFKRFNVKLN